MVEGTVKSASECRPIADVQVTALAGNRDRIATVDTDSSGNWKFDAITDFAWLHFDKVGYGSKLVARRDLKPCVRLLEDGVIGYHNKLWFYPGESPQVFVHSSAAYRARLFRHGVSKELALDLGEHPPQARQVPDTRWVAEGLPWAPSWNYALPGDLRPGLYSLLLESADQSFAIPVVIATPPEQRGKRSRLAVLANTLTWQAYNFHGGRSKYHCWEERVIPSEPFIPSWRYHLQQRMKDILLPHRLRHWLRRLRCPRPAWQLQPLSVRRPFTHCGLEADDVLLPFTNHLAAGEWRLLAWLERQGIDYDFIAGEELHASPDLLSSYQALLFSTHCEYLTKEMFAGLRHFHTEQGGWLLNISGNSLYCEVEILREAMRFVGGLFVDSCADETQLLGVRFTRNDIGTLAPYRVVKPNHWSFAGIRLPSDHCFGRRSLNQETPRTAQGLDPSRPGESPVVYGQGASGWETDKISETAPKDITVIAKGMNRFGGADMVVREPSGARGGLFSASSITFSGALLVDGVASQLVMNVMERALHGKKQADVQASNQPRQKQAA